MIKKLHVIILVIIGFTCLISCGEIKTENSFYYWKTRFHLDKYQRNMLKDLGISKLYVRYFDIGYNNASKRTIPISKIEFPKGEIDYKIIPVVYITNKSIKKTSKKDIYLLATNTFKLIKSINSSHKIITSEIQIDCDWTVSTKEKYFLYLEEIKKICAHNNITLSATIRLHQIKYPKITGIPPIDKGMLMYYNIGKLSADPKRNSIYNQADASLYSSYLKDYPLKLDLAIASFSWAIHSRKGKILNLINNADKKNYKEGFLNLRDDFLEANKSFSLNGRYFIKGDKIKFEIIDYKSAIKSAQYLKENINNHSRTISLFSLESSKKKNYETENYQEIFNCFR